MEKNRILSLVLVSALALGGLFLVPPAALSYAEDAATSGSMSPMEGTLLDDPTVHEVADANGIKAAISSFSSGDTIKLTADIALSEMLVVASGKSLILDLNGHTLSNPSGGVIKMTGNTDPEHNDRPGDTVDTLTLSGNGTLSGKETIVMLTGGSDFNAANLVLNGVSITASGGDAVYQRSLYCTITLAEGSANTISAPTSGCDGIYMKNGANQIMRSTIEGNGTLHIHGGNNGVHFSSCMYPTIDAANIFASGDAGAIGIDNSHENRIRAGYYGNDVLSFCAEGYVAVDNENDETKVAYPFVVEPAGKVFLKNSTTAKFFDLPSAAINAAGETESTITLYSDVEGDISVASGQNITFFGGSFTLDGSITAAADKLIIYSGKFTSDPSKWIIFGGKVTLSGGVYTVEGDLPYEDGAYHISNLRELAGFRFIVNVMGKTFEGEKVLLDADIDISEKLSEWEPIGYDSCYFKGTFDGQGHTISKMMISSGSYVGFFSYLSGTVKNLRMADCSMTTKGASGIIAGWIEGDSFEAQNLSFENCSINCTHYCGMIAAYCLADKSTISGISIASDCSITGYIPGSLSGYVSASNVFTAVNCENNAKIKAIGSGGGMVGHTDAYTKGLRFENCVNNGSITAIAYPEDSWYSVIYIGGMIGYRAPNAVTTSVFTNCKNTGAITCMNEGGNRGVGGFIGYTAGNPCIYTNCANTGNITGRYASGFMGMHNADNNSRFYSCLNAGSLSKGNAAQENTGNFIGNGSTTNMLASRPEIAESVTYGGSNRIYVPGEDADHGTDPQYMARVGGPIDGAYYTTLAAAVEAASRENAKNTDIYLLADSNESIVISAPLTIETATAKKASGYYEMPNVSAASGIITKTETTSILANNTLHSYEYVIIAEITRDGKTTGYPSLARAIAAAQDGDTIELVKDIELEDGAEFTVEGNIELTIDGKGHKISPAGDSSNKDYVFMFGDTQNPGQIVEARQYTLKNLTIEGFAHRRHILRAEKCALSLENCTVQNCDLTESTSSDSNVFLATHANISIDGCSFIGNKAKASMVDFNSNASSAYPGTDYTLLINNSLFSGNTANTVSVVRASEAKKTTVSDTTFINNTVNTTNNGAVLYFDEDSKTSSCTGSLFKDNVINYTTSDGYDDRTRAAGAIFAFIPAENKGTISGNAFDGNSVAKQNANYLPCYAKAVGLKSGSSDCDLSGNYWGGSEPKIGIANIESENNDIYAESASTKAEAVTYAVSYSENTENHGVTVNGIAPTSAAIASISKNGATSYYGSLAEAVAAAEDGDTIKLLKDTQEKGIGIPAGKHITIDGAKEGEGVYTVSTSDNYPVLILLDGANLSLNNITIKNTAPKNSTAAAGIYAYQNGASILELNNCNIESSYYALYVLPGATLNASIENSTLSGYAAIYLYGASGSTINVSESVLRGVNPWNKNADNNFGAIFNDASDDCVVNITNCEVSASSANGNIERAFVITNKSGTPGGNSINVSGENTRVSVPSEQGLADLYSGNQISISGGYYSASPEAYVPEGKVAIANTDATTMQAYPWTIGEKTEIETPDEISFEVETAADVAETELSLSEDAGEAAAAVAEELGNVGSTISGAEDLAPAASSIANDSAVMSEELIVSAAEALTGNNIDTSAANTVVTLIVQAYLDSSIESAEKDPEEDSITELTVEIDAKYDIIATTEAYEERRNESNTVTVSTGNTLSVPEGTAVRIKLPIPKSLACSSGNTLRERLFVFHKGYEYIANVISETIEGGTAYYAEFTNPHGFSSFLITAESAVAARIGGIKYKTVQEAVDAVKNSETITVLKNSSDSLSVKLPAAEISFTVKTEGSAKLPAAYEAGSGDYEIESVTDSEYFGTAVISRLKHVDNGGGSSGKSSSSKSSGSSEQVVDVKEEAAGADPSENAGEDGSEGSGNGEAISFIDVRKDSWYKGAIDFVSARGIMGGVGDDMFMPNLNANRAMVATVLWRMEGSPETDYVLAFSDIDENEYYIGALQWAFKNNIMNGYEDNTFKPDQPITREELGLTIFRYMRALGYDATLRADISGFPDSGDVSFWALEGLRWANGSGLIKGRELDSGRGGLVNYLKPQEGATRAELATMLMRMMSEAEE